MNNFNNVVFFICISATLCSNASSDMPDEFYELFDFKERPVSIKDINGSEKTTLILSVNYDTVRLPKDQDKSIGVLNNYFKRNLLPSTMSEKILTELKRGIKNTDSCHGYIRECVVTPESYELYYDYDNALLTLFVNGSQLDKPKAKVAYADAFNEHTALVNHFDFYTSSHHESDKSYAVNNKSIKSLPYGHLTSDLTVSSTFSKFYELSYDVSFAEDKRIYVGQFNNGVSFNSTDIVSPTKFIKQNSLSFGSTNNLALNSQRSYEQVFYFAPGPGEVRVLRDGRIIKQQAVTEGQGTLSYSELPSGRYDVEIEVLVAGKVISSEKKTIYNDLMNAPRVGYGDFILTVGKLNEAREFFPSDLDSFGDSFKSNSSRFDNVAFLNSAYSTRLYEPLLVAVGGLISDGDGMGVFGSQLYLPYGGSLNGTVSAYQSGTIAFDTQFTTDYFSIQYEKLRHQDSGDTLSAYLMGGFDYKKLSGNVFYTFSNGFNSYYSYTQGKYYLRGHEQPYTEYNTSAIGLGYNLPWDAKLDVTLDYDHVSKNHTAFMTIQVPFGSDWEAKFNTGDSSAGGKEYRVGIVKNNLIERSNVSSSLELTSGYYDGRKDVISEMYGNVSTRETAFQGNANVYANNGGNYGVSGSLSSSQIISSNGINFTSQRADAYTIINTDIDELSVSSNDSYGFITLRKNEKLDSKQFLYDSHQSIPVSTYDSYSINIDTESVSLYNSGEQGFDGFTYPGSAVVIQPRLKPLVTFVSSFSDVFDDPIDEVICKGFGCVDVVKVMDGVFRVTLVEGSDFVLYAGADRCLVPRDYEDAELMNFGNNYCLPDAKPRTVISVARQDSIAQYQLYYAGTFDDTSLVRDYINKLMSTDDTVYQRKIGSNIAIYLLMDGGDAFTLSKSQQMLIDSMQLYARENQSMNSISQPIVMREHKQELKSD